MTPTDHLRQDLDYVSNAVRHHDHAVGVPAIYFLWAAIVPVGFALADFMPQIAGAFWFVCGIGGGLLSWWLGGRDARKSGINDEALGRRHGYHWMIGGIGFFLTALPMFAGQVEPASVTSSFLLVAGLTYALAGVHLERPLLWSGLLMLAAYAALVLFSPPYTWTITGLVIGLSLLWAGIAAVHSRRAGAGQ